MIPLKYLIQYPLLCVNSESEYRETWFMNRFFNKKSAKVERFDDGTEYDRSQSGQKYAQRR